MDSTHGRKAVHTRLERWYFKTVFTFKTNASYINSVEKFITTLCIVVDRLSLPYLADPWTLFASTWVWWCERGRTQASVGCSPHHTARCSCLPKTTVCTITSMNKINGNFQTNFKVSVKTIEMLFLCDIQSKVSLNSLNKTLKFPARFWYT